MALQGTPKEGLTELATRIYVEGGDLTLVAYMNPGNSLGDLSVAVDLVQPQFANGYAPIVLSGQYSIVDGVASYLHTSGGDPGWIATGDWGPNPVVGAALVYGATLVHFRDFQAPQVMKAGDKLYITITDLLGPGG